MAGALIAVTLSPATSRPGAAAKVDPLIALRYE